MKHPLVLLSTLALLVPLTLQSCAPNATSPSQTDASQSESTTEPATTATSAPSGETGTLQVRANGEDFIRQGFVSKDGWQLDFEHVYVTLADVTAYQTDPPFDPEAGQPLEPKAEVRLVDIKTVDLAEGGETAEPIVVGETEAPAGRFNALSWQMVKPTSGAAAGYPLMLVGTATKDGETVNFTLRLDEELAFTCGDFVGEQRKGILTAGGTADLEATFHFDHLFGDADTPANDSLNTGALGFAPLAAIAQNGELDADTATLRQQLAPEDFEKLMGILPSLGHVGEGHCEETATS